MDKASKAKTLATASTLQKVVCPAPERDPQEILSNGWRKVGEQKRYTNRLANGNPEHGVLLPSRESSFSDSSTQNSRQNGRQVLDKMFGHLRPHHNIIPTAVLKPEDQELENGLGTQAARAAFYRPAIAPVLAPVPTLDTQIAEGGTALAAAAAGRQPQGSPSRPHPQPQPQPHQSALPPHLQPHLQANRRASQAGAGAGDVPSGAAVKAAGSAGGSEWSEGDLPGGADEDRPSSSSAPGSGSGASPRTSRYRRPLVAGAITAAAPAGGSGGANLSAGQVMVPTPPAQPPPVRRAASLTRGSSIKRTASLNGAAGAAAVAGGGAHRASVRLAGGSTGGASPTAAVTDRRATLPSVAKSYPSDNGAPITLAAGGHGHGNGHGPEAPRLPAAAAAAGAPPHAHRRASVSGDSGLPLIAIAMLSNGGSTGTAVLPVSKAAGGGGRARRTSQVVLDGGGAAGGGAAAAASVASGVAGGAAVGAHSPPHHGVSGGSNSSGGGGGGGGQSTQMPHIVAHRGGSGHGAGAAGQSVSADGTTARWSARGSGGGGGSPTRDIPPGGGGAAAAAATGTGTSSWVPARSGASVTGPSGGPLLRWSNNGAPNAATLAAEVATTAPTALAQISLLAQIAEGHNGGGGGGGTGGGGGGGGGVVNPAVPLSGLDNLAGTGLADAISQLRNIRMGGVSNGGAGNGNGSGGGGGSSGGAKERKVEPGLAGVIPLQLLPVSLPPVDAWQAGGRQQAELDPCKGIRLVDTANYVLPRPTAEVFLQAKMAHHQAAMRDLVKAEGAPMSETEMEAVKLLGRLERSGARHRNFDDVGDEGEAVGVGRAEDLDRPG